MTALALAGLHMDIHSITYEVIAIAVSVLLMSKKIVKLIIY